MWGPPVLLGGGFLAGRLCKIGTGPGLGRRADGAVVVNFGGCCGD